MTELVPVSQWVYHLYRVEFLTEEGGRFLKTAYVTASSENHLRADCDEAAPSDCGWYQWEVVRENVGHPRVTGRMHGMDVHEDGWSHAKWLLQKN